MHPTPFRARRSSTPLTGTIRVPGDKSISHRSLMLGALAVGESRIEGLLEGEDVLRTAAAMRALGAEVTQDSPGHWRVSGRGVGGLVEPAEVLDMGNAGTGARLLAGVLAGQGITAFLTGDASLRSRPMARVIEPLSRCGARFFSRSGGRLPMAILGAAEPLPIDWTQKVASAQVKSAVLLAGLTAPGITRVVEPEPTRDHTETMLRHLGATVVVNQLTGGGREVLLTGQPELRARDIVVPGDPSSAAFPIIAALLVPGSEVTIERVLLNPLRTGLLTTLDEMGGAIEIRNRIDQAGEPVGDLVIRHRILRGVDVPPERAPSMIDEYPVLAIAAAFATGTTRLRGLAELKVKESDRLAATARNLEALGARVLVDGDDLIVHGSGLPLPGGARLLTHMDHRLAMSALVAGMATIEPVEVDDAAFIDTSFPGFAALMRSLGGDVAAN